MWKVAGGYGAMAVAFGRCNCGSCGRGRKLRLANGLFVAWRPRVLAGPDRATSREDTQYPCVHVLSIDFALLSRTFVPVTRQNDLGSWLLRENFVTEQNTSCRQDKNNNTIMLPLSAGALCHQKEACQVNLCLRDSHADVNSNSHVDFACPRTLTRT